MGMNVVPEIPQATRRKYSAEEKIRISHRGQAVRALIAETKFTGILM